MQEVAHENWRGAQRAGLRTSAIRYDEAAGVLPAPQRASGRRTHDESALSWLAVIELDAVIAPAEAMMRELREALRCGCVEVEQCGRTLLKDRKVADCLQRARLPGRKFAANR